MYIFHTKDIDEDCHGIVTAIEYCYQYTCSMAGAVFNWTVLILDDVESTFNITKIYNIESVNRINGDSRHEQCTQCDRKEINDLEFPRGGFTFGVAEAPHQNNSNTTLLGFPDSLSQYTVKTILLNRDRVTFTIGSSVPKDIDGEVQRGLRMLWFVVGKLNDTLCCYNYYGMCNE